MKISRHSQLQPLKEIWLGDTYPESFYSQFNQQTQDVFGYITEITRRDLAKIERKLQELGVTVQRPQFHDSVDAYRDDYGNLIRPPISPCDFALSLDDTLWVIPQYCRGAEPFQHVINQYLDQGQRVVVLDRSQDDMCWINFPSVVVLGRDIYMDYDATNDLAVSANLAAAQQLADRGYRIHISTTGDHSDAIFCPIRPGQILSTHYRSSYANSFPGWQVHYLVAPEDLHLRPIEQRWWLPGYDHAVFNPVILEIAENWLGTVNETVFEVNIIVVDEHNIICPTQKDSTLHWLESIGVTPHVIDFEAGGFWDAGLHCLTADITRLGDCPDYCIEDRGPGIFYVSEW